LVKHKIPHQVAPISYARPRFFVKIQRSTKTVEPPESQGLKSP